MSLINQPLQTFLDQLASGEAVPGGGSVAALSGSLAASLVAMVCRLTIGKKGYEAVSAEMETLVPRAEMLQRELRDLMQADIDAYARVMDAYKLSKETDAQKSARTFAIQAALKHASDVPMIVAEKCAAILDLAQSVASHGNKNAASDAAVCALMAEAGLRGAAFNVSINLGSIKDQTYSNEKRARIAQLVARAAQIKSEILATVEGRM